MRKIQSQNQIHLGKKYGGRVERRLYSTRSHERKNWKKEASKVYALEAPSYLLALSHQLAQWAVGKRNFVSPQNVLFRRCYALSRARSVRGAERGRKEGKNFSGGASLREGEKEGSEKIKMAALKK